MPNAKTFTICLNTNKSFLAKYLFNDSGDDNLKLFNGNELDQIQEKFLVSNLPNVQNLVVSFKHHLGGGYIDNILELKSNNYYNYIEECCFIGQIYG